MIDYLKLNEITPILDVPKDTLYTCSMIPDLHWLLRIKSNNRDKELLAMQQASIMTGIYNMTKVNKINYTLYGGDIWDRGEKTIDASLYDVQQDFLTEMNEITESYTDYGNHEFTFGQYNPFYRYVDIKHPEVLRILQKAKFTYPKKPITPLMKCVPMLDFGSAHIHFIPYDPDKRDFVVNDSYDTFNVGIFHNDYITKESENAYFHHKTGHGLSIYGSNLFECFDVVILNHLHKPFQTFELPNTKRTKIIIPGGACQKAIDETHKKIDIPILYIAQSGCGMTSLPLYLGNIEDTTIQEMVDEQREKRAISKFIKTSKKVSKTKSHDALLDTIDNPRVRTIMANAHKLELPISIRRYKGLE